MGLERSASVCTIMIIAMRPEKRTTNFFTTHFNFSGFSYATSNIRFNFNSISYFLTWMETLLLLPTLRPRHFTLRRCRHRRLFNQGEY